MSWTTIVVQVVPGHGVASGKADDPRFPEGTLSMQRPFFTERGFDLERYHKGTINVSIKPHRYKIRRPALTFRKIKWSADLPAEDFSFCDCRIGKIDCEDFVDGMIYYPHPETKPEFFQDPSTLEILAPFVDGAESGARVQLKLNGNQIQIT